MKTNRLYSLDAMRGILMLLGVYFHLAFHYHPGNSTGGHWVFWLFTLWVHFFRMPAFFLIAGFFGALLFYRRGSKEMIVNRFKRIFLPLIIFITPIHIIDMYGIKFTEFRKEDFGILESFKMSLTYNFPNWEFFTDATHHLWFLYYLFFISIIVYLSIKVLKKLKIKVNIKSLFWLFDKKPTISVLLSCLVYALLMALMDKTMAQGGGFWWAWTWFLDSGAIKTFIAFCFFYFLGWQIYHQKEKLVKLSAWKYLFLNIIMTLIIDKSVIELFTIGNFIPSQYDFYNEVTLKESLKIKNVKKKKVTFLVDMSEQEVVSGDGENPAVYLNVTPWRTPHGFEMKNIGGGIWTITKDFYPGVYDYKFRNGFNEDWGPPNWENKDTLKLQGCGYGDSGNRKFRVEDESLTLGVFCWSECTDCFGNNISIAFYNEPPDIIIYKRAFIFLWNFGIPLYVMFWLAFFIRVFNKPSKILRYVSDSSYWVYIIHTVFIAFVPALFHQSDMNVFIKFILSSFLITLFCFSTYQLFVRKTFIGKLLNGRKYD